MSDDFFAPFRKPPPPEFAAALHERISKPMNTRSERRTLRRLALSAGALLIAALLILAVSPSARAFAEGIIRQIGGYALTQDPVEVDASRPPSSVTIERTDDSVIVHTANDVQSADTLAGASDLAGFAVLDPTYLPAGYSAMTDWLVNTERGARIASKGYKDATNNLFMVNELRFADGSAPQVYHHDVIEDVTVRGQSGVWLPDPASPNGKNALVWAENGITYSIISNTLGLDEMLKIAESLK